MRSEEGDLIIYVKSDYIIYSGLFAIRHLDCTSSVDVDNKIPAGSAFIPSPPVLHHGQERCLSLLLPSERR